MKIDIRKISWIVLYREKMGEYFWKCTRKSEREREGMKEKVRKEMKN